jgi:hypothetical protein
MSAVALAIATVGASGAVLDQQKQLDAHSWWDNRDWDWYKANIPFFECPDADIVTTYYYRWELITKHLTYGSPNSGYSFTEFIDRPFWSGTYGAISCPAGHQLYEVRWLRDPQYAQDYGRYWFRTPGAQPRRYGCWIADGMWATHQVHPDGAFLKDLLPDLKTNYFGWEKRQFVPEVGLFWQNGHDDGMEYNITSRQTADILLGANCFRPGFNAYMYADALAIARVARMAGDAVTAEIFEKKAASLKSNVQKLLWDPKREFFFPMFSRDEKDKEGNVVKAMTLTYQSGKHAGSPHGREEHGYIPWQFGMVDPGFESAWKFLMDRQYFYADYGPLTVERNDPMFLLQKTCCWWSGQSWPYATAQTLKGMANLLQQYQQQHVSPADYVKLLHIYAATHRKNGRPYLAEACHPDTGSWEGHDGYNHSEHYFHSSFNDLIITGLIGLQPSDDDVLRLKPLAPADWPYFALDDVPYRGHLLSVLWDKDGSRYGKGAGLRVFASGREIASRTTLGSITAALPPAKPVAKPMRHNYAVNNDGDYYPRITASHVDAKRPLYKVNDGNYWYTLHPPNRWTCEGSTAAEDWVAIEFGTPRRIDTVKLYFLDDGTNVAAPAAFTLERREGNEWRPLPAQERSPAKPEGHRPNAVRFPPQEIQALRAVFKHASGRRSGLTEIEAWGDASGPYEPAPPPKGNLAINITGNGVPKATASFSDRFGGIPKHAIDGKVSYRAEPVNRWTSFGSTNTSDWIEVDFGAEKQLGRAEIYIYDDRGGVQAPASYVLQYVVDGKWLDVPAQVRTPEAPAGNMANTVRFPKVTTSKVRLVFTHKGKSRSGITELELWPE